MAESLNRIGIVSSVDYEKGMVSVTYPDRDKSTTGLFPYLCPSDDYKMPAVGERVLVAHLSSNTAQGVVVGKFFSLDNPPKNSGDKVSRKEMGTDAYIECKDNEITFHDKNGSATLKDIITLLDS